MTVEIIGREIALLDRKGKHVRRRILSAFICPRCHQVLKAYFETEKPVEIAERDSRVGIAQQFRSLVVPDGQAVISETHREYGGACELEIYWSASLRHNLNDWLKKHHPERRCSADSAAINRVKVGRISGLAPIPDVAGGEACMLGFDPEAWCPPWDHQRESYHEWDRRAAETAKKKLAQLGVISGT